MNLPKSEFKIVSEMNLAFGNPYPARRQFYGEDPAITEAAWGKVKNQLKNVWDEVTELMDAVQKKSVKDIRDALCDIRVFLYGGFHFMGHNFDRDTAVNNNVMKDMLRDMNVTAAYTTLQNLMMSQVKRQSYDGTVGAIRLMLWYTDFVGEYIGIEEYQRYEDMRTVITGNMTRFIKDEADLTKTKEKFLAKGVMTFYTQGVYPTMILKSAADYPDAPKGKFLKAVSYTEPQFDPLPNEDVILVKTEEFFSY